MKTVESDSVTPANWVLELRALARHAGWEPAIAPIVTRLREIGGTTTRLVVAGGPNAGKSSVVNALVGRTVLPVTAVTSRIRFVIDHAVQEDRDACTIRGTSRPVSQ